MPEYTEGRQAAGRHFPKMPAGCDYPYEPDLSSYGPALLIDLFYQDTGNGDLSSHGGLIADGTR